MGFGSQLGGRGREFAGIVLRKSLTHDRSRLLTGAYHRAAVFGLACSVSIRIQSRTFKCGFAAESIFARNGESYLFLFKCWRKLQ